MLRPGYATGVAELMRSRRAAGHELVHGELLAGDRGGRDVFLAGYQGLPWAPRRPHAEVVQVVRMHRLHGRGAGWVDLNLLVSVMARRWQLWTADDRLGALAQELGLAYMP